MPTTPRSTYHHGDLRAALLREAVDVVRVGGPAALVLREVTRRAGVSTNAAYRHFADRDALMEDVTFHSQAACARTMEARLGDPGSMTGRERLHETGLGYIDFARAEPGLFEAAFFVPVDLRRAQDPRSAGDSGLTPFQLLSVALDAMLEDGSLSPEARPMAEVPCWSSVHGFSMLVVRGPLRFVPPEQVDALAERVVAGAIAAITSPTPH